MKTKMYKADKFFLDENRRSGREVYYGSYWKKKATWPMYSLYWLDTTGELYIRPNIGKNVNTDTVEVLGVIPEKFIGGMLRHWEEQEDYLLSWVIERIKIYELGEKIYELSK